MPGTVDDTTYDPFVGPNLDTTKWMFLQYPMEQGDPWICCDPNAITTVQDGRLAVEIPVFELSHAVQIIDNCKFVLLSTESFEVPRGGTLVVKADLTAEGFGATPHGWQDGFAAIVVIDPSTGLVFDICAASQGVGAIHERLPFGPDATPFTHLVEAPLSGIEGGPEQVYRCVTTLDAKSSTAVWSVNGREIFRAAGVEIPESIHVGLGVFTLHPVGDGGSRSNHGQGLKASWSNISVTAS
jgi:hypothetical protein